MYVHVCLCVRVRVCVRACAEGTLSGVDLRGRGSRGPVLFLRCAVFSGSSVLLAPLGSPSSSASPSTPLPASHSKPLPALSLFLGSPASGDPAGERKHCATWRILEEHTEEGAEAENRGEG